MDELKPKEQVVLQGENVAMTVVRQVGDTVTCSRWHKDGSYEDVEFQRDRLNRISLPRAVQPKPFRMG